MHVPKYAARTFLTALKIASAGVPKNLLSTCLKVVGAAVAGQHMLVTLLQSALHPSLTA